MRRNQQTQSKRSINVCHDDAAVVDGVGRQLRPGCARVCGDVRDERGECATRLGFERE